MSSTSAVKVAVQSASYNIILQVLMRILSSLSNAVLLRYISRDALGVINVRLMLLYSTCQFFSREAFRRSCLSKFDEKNFQRKFNLLWLNFPTCLLCSTILGYVWMHFLENPKPQLVPNYSQGIYVVLFSVLIESLSEPLYVFSQSYGFVKLKVVIEGLSLTVKSLLMVLTLMFYPGHSIFAFAISQGLCSCIYTSAFYIYFLWYFNKSEKPILEKLPINSIGGFFPKFSMTFVDSPDLHLTWSFFKQTLLKQLLTEGERYIMTFFNVLTFAEQGLYDVVSNLGSLSARFIFLPIEDSGYCLFTQLMSRNAKENTNENTVKCYNILQTLLKLLLLLGLMILTFGYSYSQLLLLLYGGQILSSSIAVTLLRWHCGYVLLLALNGITECFKFAVMDHHQINAYNKSMILLSTGFLCAAYGLAKVFGGVGFIMANCINMGFRVVHSIYFIAYYFDISKIKLLRKLMPHPIVLFTLILSFVLTGASEIYFCCNEGVWGNVAHLLLGMSCFLFVILCTTLNETEIMKFIFEQWDRKKDVKDEDSKKRS